MSHIEYYKSFGLSQTDAVDPIILRWLLSKYRDLDKFDKNEAKKFEDLFFNDVYLKNILLNSDDRLLITLFHELPAEKFRNHLDFFINGWNNWTDSLAC